MTIIHKDLDELRSRIIGQWPPREGHDVERAACLMILDEMQFVNPWRPISEAPRDSTMLELIVNYEGEDNAHPLEDGLVAVTIGFNSYDDNYEEDWKFAGWCWSHDHFTQGNGRPTHWRYWQRPAIPEASEPAPT